jgi:hypothetical protein
MGLEDRGGGPQLVLAAASGQNTALFALRSLSKRREEVRQRYAKCSGQSAVCGLEFEELIAEFTAEAKAIQKTGKGADGSGGRGKKTLAPHDAKVSSAKKTASKLAKLVGTSTKTVERAQALKKASPEKLAEVKAGTKSLSQAGREVTKAAMKAVAKLPTGKFRVFYADPPWSYGSFSFATFSGTDRQEFR